MQLLLLDFTTPLHNQPPSPHSRAGFVVSVPTSIRSVCDPNAALSVVDRVAIRRYDRYGSLPRTWGSRGPLPEGIARTPCAGQPAPEKGTDSLLFLPRTSLLNPLLLPAADTSHSPLFHAHTYIARDPTVEARLAGSVVMNDNRDPRALRPRLNPLLTSSLGPYSHQANTPISAMSYSSNSHNAPTPLSAIQPYNPQEWLPSPMPGPGPDRGPQLSSPDSTGND